MTQTEPKRTRLIKSFSWSKVDDRLLNELLLAADDSKEPRSRRLREIQKKPRALRVNEAEESFGSPPHAAWMSRLAKPLVDVWLPQLPAAQVIDLADMVGVGLATSVGGSRLTKPTALALLQKRRRTNNFLVNLRKEFVRSHRVERRVEVGKTKPEAQGPYVLRGEELARPYEPYAHQESTWNRLDDLWGEEPGFSARIVLPTGAGKTETAIEWLLDRIEAEPELRVLWVAHQQELVVQAMERFRACVARRGTRLKLNGRAIHAGASPWTTLADPDIDVAAVTIQSLTRSLGRNKRKAIKSFLRRPLILVIDEAHHAPSGTYEYLFEDILVNYPPRATLALTATPWPTAAWAKQRMRELFPTLAYEAQQEDLVAQGVLARAVFNTVETHQTIEISAKEAQQARRSDLPASVLARLANAPRDAEVLAVYKKDPDRWGKTLVFATGIHHADVLAKRFAALVDTRVLHSQVEGDRGEILTWFRSSPGPCVLVSVGMLTEGVDLPDARTAFLVRPTASHTLLRQMIGRVLRGPRAGGDTEAHIVYFADHWGAFGATLRPEAVVDGESEGDWKPLGLGMASGIRVPFDVVGSLQSMFDAFGDEPLLEDEDDVEDQEEAVFDLLLHESRLAGYFDLLDRRVAVLEHQREGIQDVLSAAADGSRLPALLSFFEEAHLPHPAHEDLQALVDHVREIGEEPTFVDLDASIGPSLCADRILAGGALTQTEREQLIEQAFNESLAPIAYKSLGFFAEAVDREIRDRSRPRSPEREIPVSTASKLPRADRQLWPILHRVVDQAEQLLPAHLLERLDVLPEIAWTKRVHRSSFATWAPRVRGHDGQVIHVNRLLNAPRKHVPDAMLEYLVWHELLHHVLPGQGHDAEFRDLEATWPDSELWDATIDTFHERWSTDPKDYPSKG